MENNVFLKSWAENDGWWIRGFEYLADVHDADFETVADAGCGSEVGEGDVVSGSDAEGAEIGSYDDLCGVAEAVS